MNHSPEVPVTIQEHFITFLPVEETTSKELTAVLLKELDNLGLQIKNIRGQGYDSGANMKGHKSGLQSRILEYNPRAFFTPCACHSLNLLLGDMAKSFRVFTLIPYFDVANSVLILNLIAIRMCIHTFFY